MSKGAAHSRRALNSHGEVKASAADTLRAALFPPKEPEPEMSWLDIALELKRSNDRFEAEREAKRQAEANQPDPEKTAAELLREALTGQANPAQTAEGQAPQGTSPAHIPLNGPGVLNVILGAIPGATIDGQPS